MNIGKKSEKLEELLRSRKVEWIAYHLGVSTSTVFKWKAGMVNPSRMAQEKIEILFEINKGKKEE